MEPVTNRILHLTTFRKPGNVILSNCFYNRLLALLKSGRINNRLLCKLAAQKDFIKFLPEIGCIDIAQSESVSAVNHRSFLTMLYSFKNQDVGQIDMYVRMYDDLKRGQGDNPTIGILL